LLLIATVAFIYLTVLLAVPLVIPPTQLEPVYSGSNQTASSIYDIGSGVGIGVPNPAASLSVRPKASFDYSALAGPDTLADIHLGYVRSPGYSSYGICMADACIGANGTSLNFGWVTGPKSMSNSMIFSAKGNLWVAGGYTSGSDLRMKKDVRDLGDRWQSLLELRPVEFRWKDKRMGSDTHLGLIAQEVEPWFPELVREEGGDHLLSIEYTGLIPPLIEATKQLTSREDQLSKHVADLARALSDLKIENDRLKARVVILEKALHAAVAEQ
jgi:hypothetical protein